ncbi:MAG: hypothetical protein ACFB02_21115 [Mastigocoleus sp.]
MNSPAPYIPIIEIRGFGRVLVIFYLPFQISDRCLCSVSERRRLLTTIAGSVAVLLGRD